MISQPAFFSTCIINLIFKKDHAGLRVNHINHLLECLHTSEDTDVYFYTRLTVGANEQIFYNCG